MSAISSEILSVKINTLLTNIGLLLLVCAVPTGVVRVTDGTYSNIVTHFKILYLLSNHCDLSNHLMANTSWVWNFT